jgi:serine/threonine-protein kinase
VSEPITPTRFARLEELFDRVLQLPDDDRGALLAAVEAESPSLAGDLRGLLAAHARTDSLVSPVRRGSTTDASWTGMRLGAYEIGQRIGAGGMGAVYEAVRADDQYRQRVAVKFLRRVADGAQAARRFRAERQFLASLQHPGIAALLDGGVTPDGQPYFVMEYIDGEPITRWCDARSLPLADRLARFRDVCQAVRAAHQKLVVHRDLKPGNILVTADGLVKLLDFGIAKWLGAEDAVEALDGTLTVAGARVYTPEYAAPEQVRGEPVDTTADVYALGVLLFELLTGRRPFALAGLSPAELERVVSEQPAPKPSSVLTPDRHGALGLRTPAAARRAIEGDLDAIVLTALRKEPARRYASVDRLLEDITRHLEGRPVAARPDGAGYRLAKRVRRRRLETVAGAVAVLSLVGGTAAALRQAARAEEAATRASAVTTFLTTTLGAARPDAFGRDILMRDVLDSAVVRADSTTAPPAVEGAIRDVLGGSFLALGEYEKAATQYERSVAAWARAGTALDSARAVALKQLATVHWSAGDNAAADSVLRAAVPLYERHFANDPLARSAILDLRGQVIANDGRLAEALPLMLQSLAIFRAEFPEQPGEAASTYVSAGVITSNLGDHNGADTLMLAGLAAARRAYGDVHPMVASALTARATVLERLGRLDSAGTLYREVIAIREKLLGPTHPDLAFTMTNYADHLRRRGLHAASTEWSRRVVALRGTSLDDTHMALAGAMLQLGLALGAMDSVGPGERWVREAYRLRSAAVPPDHWLLASTNSALGEVLTRAGRYAEAERLLVPAETRLSAALGGSTEIVQDVRRRLEQLYLAQGRTAEAARWAERLGH